MTPILPTWLAGTVDDVLIRPMRPDDVAASERLSSEAFLERDLRDQRRRDSTPALRSVDRADRWIRRVHALLATDGPGCWVADLGGEQVGFATSLKREGMWILATYAVRPGLQGRGIGRLVLDAALTHSRACLRGMLSASDDPAALRRYLLAGFELHPQMTLTGSIDRDAIAPTERVRPGSRADRELLDSTDRATRGYAHGSDHDLLAVDTRLLVTHTRTGAGYAYVDDTGIEALAATDRRHATALLWAALAQMPGPARIEHVTAANQWALEVATAAGLAVGQRGYLALRGMKPPAPYIHHGALL